MHLIDIPREKIAEDAKRFSTKRDWRRAGAEAVKAGRQSMFRAAFAHGADFFHSCTQHMFRAEVTGRVWESTIYTNEFLVKSASPYHHIIDWKRADARVYKRARIRARRDAAWESEWWPKITGHMKDWNESAYQVYAYEFDDGAAYVGLTCKPERRHDNKDGHGAKGPVFEHSQVTGLKPTLRVLSEGLSGKVAGDLEDDFIEKYREDDWSMLNSSVGGSLGKVTYKHTDEEIISRAAGFKTRSEWLKSDQYGYKSAKKRGIFERCVSHMPGEHDISAERCRAPRAPVSDITRQKMSESASLRIDQFQSNKFSAVLNNNMKTIILVGGQPVTHANELAKELAKDRGGQFLTPDASANWLQVDNRISEAQDGAVFVVTSAIPGRSIQRFMAAGFKVELADAGSAPGANSGSVNNYNCSVREAKRALGLLPPIKRKMADGAASPAAAVPAVESKVAVYTLLDAGGRCLFAGITDHTPMARRDAMSNINMALVSGIYHGDVVWLALAQSWGRMVNQFDGFFKIVAECADETAARAELEKAAATVEKPSSVASPDLADASAWVTESLAKVGLAMLPTKLKNMAVVSFSAWDEVRAEVLFQAALRCQRANPAVVSMAGVTYVFPMTVKELMAEVDKIVEALK